MLLVHGVFVPSFVRNAKARSRKIRAELKKMAPTFSTDTERRDAFHKVISAIVEELRDTIVNGHSTAICVDKKSNLNVVPNVVDMYRTYAEDILKEVIPDFFSDDYYEKASATLESVDGMALPNLRAGRVCNPLILEVFEDELAPRAKNLVSDVREYMQEVLCELCKNASAAYPFLLNEMQTALVDEYMEIKENETKEAVLNICNAELAWPYTQNPAYGKTINLVHEKVRKAREGEVVHAVQVGDKSGTIPPKKIQAVGDIPQDFLNKMVRTRSNSNEEDIRTLQVTISTYVDLVCRNIFDTVPKQVQLFLVTGTYSGLEGWMLDRVPADDLRRLFSEDSQTQWKRREMERKLALFEEGLQIVHDASIYRGR